MPIYCLKYGGQEQNSEADLGVGVHSSVVECLLSTCKALGSTPNNTTNNKNQSSEALEQRGAAGRARQEIAWDAGPLLSHVCERS